MTPAALNENSIVSFAALATILYLLESALPAPLPGVKLGLANIIILIIFWYWGWRAAAWVSLLRIVAGGLLMGTLFSPGFFLSLSGALGNILFLILIGQYYHHLFGLTGLSILMALIHISCQFLTAYLLFLPYPGLLKLLPILLLTAWIFGFANGLFAQWLLPVLPMESKQC